MYPAQLRPDVPKGNPPRHPASNTSAGPAQRSLNPHSDQANMACSKQPVTQPVSVEWLLPQRHSQVPPAGHLSAAPAANASSQYGLNTVGPAVSHAKQMHGIPNAPAAGSSAGSAARRASGSNIPSPVQNGPHSNAHQGSRPFKNPHTQAPGAQWSKDPAAAIASAVPSGRRREDCPYRGHKRQPAADMDPPFCVATAVRSPHHYMRAFVSIQYLVYTS